MNAAWHERNPMPKNATMAQRVKWHTAHAKACACRAIPKPVAAEISKAGSGYSCTPLAAKLGLAAGKTLLTLGPPSNYADLIGPTIGELERAKSLGPTVDIVHMFTASRSRLATGAARLPASTETRCGGLGVVAEESVRRAD
jgi:hypothetical protein